MLHFLLSFLFFAFSCLPLVSLPFRSACKRELDVAWNYNTASQKVSFLPVRIVRQWQEQDKLLFELVAMQRASIRLGSGETAAGDEGLLCAPCPLSSAALAPVGSSCARIVTSMAGPTHSSWEPSWGHTGWPQLLSSFSQNHASVMHPCIPLLK